MNVLISSQILHAKLNSGTPDLMSEGCRGIWDLSIKRDNHLDIGRDCISALIGALSSGQIKVGGRGWGNLEAMRSDQRIDYDRGHVYGR